MGGIYFDKGADTEAGLTNEIKKEEESRKNKEEADAADHVSQLRSSNLRHLLDVKYGFKLVTMPKTLEAHQSP